MEEETHQHNNSNNLVFEEEELVDSLHRKHSRSYHNNNNDSASSSTVVISSNGNGNGNAECCNSSSSSIIKATSMESVTSANGAADNDSATFQHNIVEEAHLLINSVYFDQDHGIWKCHHCNWTYCLGNPLIDFNQNFSGHLHMPMNFNTYNQHGPGFISETKVTESLDGVLEMKNGSVSCSILEMNSRDEDVHDKSFGSQKSSIEEMDDQCVKNLNHTEISDSSLIPLEESHEEQNLKSYSFDNEIRLAEDFDLAEEVDQEETDFDVERVLQKQNTHDLYCPNCNSCITRRVILRRRKPKIRNPRRKPKRNKEDMALLPELDSSSDNVQVPEIINTPSSNPAPADDQNSNRESEVFRCLSCFSFFIPTRDGFKLFKFFGDRTENENVQSLRKTPAGNTEDESVQNLQKTPATNPENENVRNLREEPATNTNWFFSIFASDKKEKTIEQENTPMADQNDLVNSVASLPKSVVDDLGSASAESRKEFVNYSTEDSKNLGNASTRVGNKTAEATDKINEGFNESNYNAVNTVQQLNKRDHSVPPLPSILVNSREPAEDALLGPMQGGVNAREPSTCESFLPDMSQIDKNSNLAVDKKPVQNDQDSSILGTPLPTKLFGEGELSNVSAVVCHETGENFMVSSNQGTQILDALKFGGGETKLDAIEKKITGGDVIVVVERPVEPTASQLAQNVDGSSEATNLVQTRSQISTSEQRGAGVFMDILKSIVYGGLIESITSLGVVSSAAGAGSATLNILALGLANLIGGLFIIGHNLIDLKNDNSGQSSNQTDEQEDRYQQTLGRRGNFALHAIVAILSYFIFGLLPPVIYGFSFRKSDNKDLKLAVVGSASLVCIFLLAIGKAHVRRPPKSYITTLLYFVSIGVMASGASYIAGDLIKKLVEKLGLFDSNVAVIVGWASY